MKNSSFSKVVPPSKNLWDVAVIGAGPAGCLAARDLALRGATVLLIERKTIPRPKICGACLNHRGSHVLKTAGLESLLASPTVSSASLFHLQVGRCVCRLGVGNMHVAPRSWLDGELARFAEAAGANVVTETEARVAGVESILEGDHEHRPVEVLLKPSQGEVRSVRAGAVVVADGLGHPSLQGGHGWSEQVAPTSRVGMGATFSSDHRFYQEGTIYMGVGRHGYVGVVRLSDGQLNCAAAVDPSWLSSSGGLAGAAGRLLTEARLPVPTELAQASWQGTPRLSRRSLPVARGGLFLVGDAAEYVEPFTGEGISAALATGQAVGTCVLQWLSGDRHGATARWRRQHEEMITRQNHWCRRLAWVSRHPRLALTLAQAVQRWPWMGRPVLGHLRRTDSPGEERKR